MSLLIGMAENALLPDGLIRFGIRRLDRKRLLVEGQPHRNQYRRHRERFITSMRQSQIAIKTRKANEQHYEVPAAFFEQVLGRHLKYSSCYWPEGTRDLDRRRSHILPIFQDVYGLEDAGRWLQRWRMFFMACAELWNYNDGREWIVSHYLMNKKGAL